MQRNMMCAVLTVGIFTSTLFAYSGGSGTAEAPYQIATAEDLIELGSDPNNYDKHFILTADIDLSGYTFDRAVIAADVDEDSSFDGTAFSGTFDGQDHVISHLSIQGAYYLGLFGRCSSGAVISNLGMEKVDIESIGCYVGGLVGDNYGTITSCRITGCVSGDDYFGGLAGRNDCGKIASCYSTGTFSGHLYVGGLVGFNMYGTITSCYSSGNVSGDGNAGGLVGCNIGTITSNYSTGTVTGKIYIGGLVGCNIDTIISNYSTSSVSGHDGVGGLVGFNGGTILSNYSTGLVSGDDSVGGLVGFNDGTIASSL